MKHYIIHRDYFYLHYLITMNTPKFLDSIKDGFQKMKYVMAILLVLAASGCKNNESDMTKASKNLDNAIEAASKADAAVKKDSINMETHRAERTTTKQSVQQCEQTVINEGDKLKNKQNQPTK